MRFGNPSKKSKTIASIKGHAIEFPGRVTMVDGKQPADYVKPLGAALSAEGVTFVHVPEVLRHEVISAGMLAEDEMGDEVEDAGGPKVKPEDPTKLQTEAFEAFELLTKAGQREDFSGNGMPKAAAIEKLLGYPLVTSEIKELWNKFQLSAKE